MSAAMSFAHPSVDRGLKILSLLGFVALTGCGSAPSDSAGRVQQAAEYEATDRLRIHDVELVYIAKDGTRKRMAIDHPTVAEINMTAETATGDPIRCRLQFLGSGDVDRYEFAYSVEQGTWRGKFVTFAGQEKTILDNEHGTFLLRTPN